MSHHKYHVTIEDVADEDALEEQRMSQQSCDFGDLDIDHINQNSDLKEVSGEGYSQAWDEVDALEEQARNEKLQDQSYAKANANETARLVKKAQQSSE